VQEAAALPAEPAGNVTVQDLRPQDGAAASAPRATPHADALHAGAPHAGAPHAGAPHAGAPHAGAPHAGAPSSPGAVVSAERPVGVAHRAEAASGQGSGEGAAEPAASGPSAHRVTAIALTGLSFVGAGVGVSAAIHSTSLHRLARTEC